MIARRIVYAGVVAGTLAMAVGASAQTAPKKPANATAECTDGTFSTAKTQAGACSKHGGVKTWFGAPAGAAAAATKETGKKEPAAKTDAAAKTAAPAAAAKAAGAPPAGSTGECTDGTFTRAKTQTGACSNHGGVKTWFAADTKAPAAAATAAGAGAAPAATPKNTPPPPAPTGVSGTPAPKAPAAAATSTPKAPAATKTAAGASSGKAQIVAPPAGTPDNATAKCKDGTYSFAKTHTGACSNHGGVTEWYK